jgi:excisionase family DNA binding protein
VPPPQLAAPVKGFAAWALALLVDRYGPDQMVALQRLAERGRLDPDYLGELRSSWAAIREAAEQWLAWEKQSRASVDGTTSVRLTEAPPSSSPEPLREVDTETAAKLLNVSTSRIRQMARSGEIVGRKVGRVWLVSMASVKAYRQGTSRRSG